MRYVDLSHTIEHGMVTYQGLPPPLIRDHLGREASRAHYADGVEFQIGSIEMVANTGTYLDSPFHRYEEGADLAGLDLASLAGLEGIVVRARGTRAVDAGAVERLEAKGKAVLVETGWDAHWRTERYFEENPFLTEAACRALVAAGAALVGIDSSNVDDIADRRRPAHSLLLAAGIPVVEHMRGMEALPDAGFSFFAVPPKVKGFGTFPVRAFAIVD
jgi:kynurenine formamidase